MEKLKIVLIGAGSRQFSKGVIDDIVLEPGLKALPSIEIALVDVDKERLEAMESYARRCVAYAGARNVSIAASLDRRRALAGASFVIVSVAVRRMELWEQDYRVAQSYGFKSVFAENGGPSALFHALRNFELILPVCKDIEELCPDAYLINFTNPEARILSAILNLTKVKAFGLCHGFHSLHKAVEKILERPLAELEIRSAGMNHLFACVKIADRKTGEDLKPLFEKRLSERGGDFDSMTRHLFERYGVFGLPSGDHSGEYLSYAHEFLPPCWPFGIESRKVFKGFRASLDDAYYSWGNGFGGRLDEWQASGRAERHGAYFSGKRPLDSDFVRPSGELAIPIIADIALGRSSSRPAANVLNSGLYISNLAKDACVEVPVTIGADGIHPETVGELPEAFVALIHRQHSIQKLLVRAYSERSKKLLLQALLIDPVVDSAKRAEEYLDCMLKLQADYLPSFA